MRQLPTKGKVMKRSTRATLAVFVILAASAALAQSDAQKSFDQLKSLAGIWEGKNSMNQAIQVSFKVIANGSAVMSEISGHGEDMITMFHLDGPNKLVLTHYCPSGNQPRMQATTSADGKTITFNFVDATNLASLDVGHMHRVAITVLDANHHTEEWSYADHGKDMKELFDLRRKM
jgi:hypothetical protein